MEIQAYLIINDYFEKTLMWEFDSLDKRNCMKTFVSDLKHSEGICRNLTTNVY